MCCFMCYETSVLGDYILDIQTGEYKEHCAAHNKDKLKQKLRQKIIALNLKHTN